MQSYNENCNFALWFYPLRTPSSGVEEALLEEGGEASFSLSHPIRAGSEEALG